MTEEISKNRDQTEEQILSDRTVQKTSNDAVISGDHEEHQKIYNEASEMGKTFATFSDNEEDQSFQSLLPEETVEQYQIRFAEGQKQKANKSKIDSFGIDFGDGTLETAKGKVTKPISLDISESRNLISQKSEPSEYVNNSSDSTNETEAILSKWNSAQPITIKEFLSLKPGISPIIDAYRNSLTSKENSPDKSPTLEHVFFRLRNCPWSDEIKIVRNTSNEQKDYNPATMTIEIGGNLNVSRQIETFAHEAYHASHRDLFNLYLDPALVQNKNGMATLDEYRNARFGAEAKAFETEIKINQELTSKMKGSNPITMAVLRKSPIVGFQIPGLWEKDTIELPNLRKLYESQGISGLWRFLRDEKPVRLDANGKAIRHGESYQTETSYGERYDKQYKDWYMPNFQAERSIAEQMRQKFLRSGHTSSEFEDWGY